MTENIKLIKDQLINYKYLDINIVLKGIGKLLNMSYFAYNDTITLSSDSFILDIQNDKINIQFINGELNSTYLYTQEYLEYAYKNKDYLLFYNFIKCLLYKRDCENRNLKFLNHKLYYCNCIDSMENEDVLREYQDQTAINIFTHFPRNTKILRVEKGKVNTGEFVIKENKFFINCKENKKLSILVQRGLTTENILKFL